MTVKNFLSGLEYFILLILRDQRLQHKEVYGVSIHEALCKITGKKIAYAAIYSALKSLLSKGFITSHKGDPTPERGGRAKTFYEIIGAGEIALREHELWSENFSQTYNKVKELLI